MAWVLAPALLAALIYAVNLNDYFLGDDFDLIHSFHDKPASYFVELLYNTQAGDTWDHYGLDAEQGRGLLRPLPVWLLKLDFTLWGTRPVGYHLVSTAIFCGLVAAMFFLVRRLVGSDPAAATAAFVLAVHPAFARVVPWISGREEITAALFVLLAFGAFLRHRLEGRSAAGYYVFFAAGLLTKEWTLSVLGLALLYDVLCVPSDVPPTRRLRPLARTHAPAVVIALAYLSLRWLAFGNVKGGYGGETGYFSPSAFAGYHAEFVGWLLGQTSLGPRWAVPVGVDAAAVAAVLAVAALGAGSERRPGRRLLFFGPVWYFGTTFVFHGIGFSPRHVTLPVIGWILLAIVLLDGALRARGATWKIATAPILLLAAMLFLPLTIEHARTFDEAGRTVERLRSRIEADTAGVPDGGSVYIARVPQDELAPYYFGWSLLGALRRPFTESDLANRVLIVNPQNIWMNRYDVRLPEAFDLFLDYPEPRRRLGGRVIAADPPPGMPRVDSPSP